MLKSLGHRAQPYERHNENMKLIDSTFKIVKNLEDYRNNIFIKFHNSFLNSNLTGASLLKKLSILKPLIIVLSLIQNLDLKTKLSYFYSTIIRQEFLKIFL